MNESNFQEKKFNIKPIGIKYICEYCQNGEMLLYNESSESIQLGESNMYTHKCNKCHEILLLPKVYPYIEWEFGEEL